VEHFYGDDLAGRKHGYYWMRKRLPGGNSKIYICYVPGWDFPHMVFPMEMTTEYDVDGLEFYGPLDIGDHPWEAREETVPPSPTPFEVRPRELKEVEDEAA